MMKKKITKVVLVLVGALLILAGAAYGYYKLCMDPYRGSVYDFTDAKALEEMLSAEQAREDLDFIMKNLRERHPAWMEEGDKAVAEVEAAYEEACKKLAGEFPKGISVMEFYKMASKVVAKLHDGHSYVTWYVENGERYVDDFTVIWEYGKPLSIDGIPCEELIEAYKEVCCYETDFYAEARFWGRVITNDSYLRLCGVDTSDGVVMVFDHNGTLLEHHFSMIPLEQVKGYQADTEESEEENSWVSYEIDEENSLGIFTLSSCTNNKEYRQVLDDFFEEVFGANIQNVVVDLRGNGGGNSTVADEFISYLNVDEYDGWNSKVRMGWYMIENENVVFKNHKKDRLFEGEVYVLTDTWTYSAAMDFAMLIGDNDLGTLVGKPSGNLPDSYGDCLLFTIPNSGMLQSVSYKKWYRIDQSKAGEPLMPDVVVPADEALDKVYELIQ